MLQTTNNRWAKRAACIGTDPFDWEDNARDVGQCALCDSCPVLTECAADAVEMADRGVIRAGIRISSNRGSKRKAAHHALALISAGHTIARAAARAGAEVAE